MIVVIDPRRRGSCSWADHPHPDRNSIIASRNRVDEAWSGDRRPAQAPARPGSEPGERRQGLRLRARAADLRGRRPRPQPGDGGATWRRCDDPPRQDPRCAAAWDRPARRRRAVPRAAARPRTSGSSSNQLSGSRTSPGPDAGSTTRTCDAAINTKIQQFPMSIVRDIGAVRRRRASRSCHEPLPRGSCSSFLEGSAGSGRARSRSPSSRSRSARDRSRR